MATPHSGIFSPPSVKKPVPHLPHLSWIPAKCCKASLDSELKTLVLSVLIVASLEISGHNVVLPALPLIYREKKAAQLPQWNQRCSGHQQFICYKFSFIKPAADNVPELFWVNRSFQSIQSQQPSCYSLFNNL